MAGQENCNVCFQPQNLCEPNHLDNNILRMRIVLENFDTHVVSSKKILYQLLCTYYWLHSNFLKYLFFQVVPCHYTHRLLSLSPDNWMKLKSGPQRQLTHHIFIKDEEYMCGPYWRSLVESYDLKVDDTVEFRFIPNRRHFVVNSVFDRNMQPKNWLQLPGII